MEHIRRKVLKPVIPLARIFVEDPVRIIRALKYAESGGFRLPWALSRRIKRDRTLLQDVPSSRMTEELFKILNSGHAAPIFTQQIRFDVLQYFLPRAADLVKRNGDYRTKLLARLKLLDRKRFDLGALERRDLLVFLCADYLLEFGPFEDQKRIPFREGYFAFKEFLLPITPANREVEAALREIFRNKGRLLREEPPEHLDERRETRPEGRKRRRRGRRRGSASRTAGGSPSE